MAKKIEIDESEEKQTVQKGNEIVNAASIILKKFGRDITNANGSEYLKQIPAISTGSVLLDAAISRKFKGYPEGAIIEAYGWEGAGKTLMLYLAFAEAQRIFPDKQCVLIDAERQFKFQADWARTVGVDVEKLLVLPCSTAEECFDMMHALVLGEHEADKKSGEVIRVLEPGNYSIIGVDSVTQLVSLVDSVKGMEETRQRGTQASAIGLGLKKVTSAMARADVNSGTILFFINQLRKNPNSKKGQNPEYRTGGNALPFYDTIAFKVAKVWDSEVRDSSDNIVSHDVKVTFSKNKAGSKPSEAITFTLNHDGSGVDNEKELFDVALMNGILKEFEIEHKGKMVKRFNFVDPKTDKIFDENIKYFAMKKKFQEIIDNRPELKEMINNCLKQGQFFQESDSIKEYIPDSAIKDPDKDDETNLVTEKSKNIDAKKSDNTNEEKEKKKKDKSKKRIGKLGKLKIR